MINTSQLQIGSWVRHSGGGNELWQLDISLLTDIVDGLIQVEGEPLTTDWLKRAGFEDVTMSWYTEPCYAIVIQGETFFYWMTEQSIYWDETFLRKVDAVHELQLLMAGLGRPITFDGK